MKNFKRLIAVVLTFSTLTAGVSNIIAKAEESQVLPLQVSEEVVKVMQQTDEILNSGKITFEEAEQLKAELANVSNSNEYPHYDELCTDPENGLVTDTSNHIAFITNLSGNGSGFTVGLNRYVDFYINKNILTNGIAKSNFSNGVVNVKTVSDLGGDASCRHYRIYFDVTSTIPEGTVLFTFNFPSYVYNNSDVICEYDLHLATVQNPENNPFVLNAKNGNSSTTVYKCHYALGNVNHDGFVDSNDSTLILQSIVNLLTVPSTRTELDRIVFEKAADFDKDGDVDVVDVLAINNHYNQDN